MQRYLHPLFHDPPSAPGPRVDEAIVLDAEARLGRRLPRAYVQALQSANGGPLRRSRLLSPRGPLDLRDLIGIGYDEGLDGPEGSAALAREWGYPAETLVISFEGQCALLLDYRQVEGQQEPAVAWVDTDQDEVWTLASSPARFLDDLQYPAPVVQIALHQGDVPDLEAALALGRALGAQGEARRDWTGACSLSWGQHPLRVRPNVYRGTAIVPELAATMPWVLEVEPAEIRGLLEDIARRAPRSLRLDSLRLGG